MNTKNTLRTPVWKTVYKFTVYSNVRISPNHDLVDVIKEAMNGEYIGEEVLVEQKLVDPRHVRQALIKIGNDGTFFDNPP